MILTFFFIGSAMAFVLGVAAFYKRNAGILASILFVVLAGLVGSYGIDVPVDQQVTVSEHAVQVDANTTDTNTTQLVETVYQNYGFSEPFVFSVVWLFLGLGVAFALFTFFY